MKGVDFLWSLADRRAGKRRVSIDHRVSSFAVSPTGVLYDLHTNRYLWRDLAGVWSIIDTGVKSFSLSSTGVLTVVHT
jgi:hypothetical protein